VLQLPVLLQQWERQRRAGGRVVPQLVVLDQPVDRVDAEARNAAVEPEADDVAERGHDLRVAPVEVRLLRIEAVHVPARTAARIGRPRRPAERCPPIVRRATVAPLGPDIPVRVLTEPRMLDRRVARNEVHQHSQPALVGRRDQPVEVLQRPVDRIDGPVVRDVIAEVRQRRRMDR
jgi:hypothetical protein